MIIFFSDRLLFVINAIKEEIVSRVQDISHDKGTSMTEKLDKLIEDTLGKKMCYIALWLTLVKVLLALKLQMQILYDLVTSCLQVSPQYTTNNSIHLTSWVVRNLLCFTSMIKLHYSPIACLYLSSRILRAFTLLRSVAVTSVVLKLFSEEICVSTSQSAHHHMTWPHPTVIYVMKTALKEHKMNILDFFFFRHVGSSWSSRVSPQDWGSKQPSKSVCPVT